MLLPISTRWQYALFTLALLHAHCHNARSSCIRRLLYGEPGDADYELECTGVLNRTLVEQEMRNKTDYVVLKLTDCSLDTLVDPPAQKSTTVNLESFEIRNCSIGSWLDRFTFCPEHLLLDHVALQRLDSWITWHREMQFATTVPFSYTLARSDALLRAIDTLFPKLAGLTVAPKSLRFDFSYNDLSYWEEEGAQQTVAQLFSPFANDNAADEDGEVQLEELLLTHANLTQVPRVTATIRNLLNLSSNRIRSASLADFDSFTLEDAVVDLSNNLVYLETIDQSLKNSLGSRLIISSQPTTTPSTSTSTSTTTTTSMAISATPVTATTQTSSTTTTTTATTTTTTTTTTSTTTTKSPVARSSRKRKPVNTTRKPISTEKQTSTSTSTSTTTSTSTSTSTATTTSKATSKSTTQTWTSAAESMIVMVSDYAQLADGGHGTEQPVEIGPLSATAVIAVSAACLLITVLAVAGIVLFVRRHKLLRTKAKQRDEVAGNTEIDITRWDPENGIITVNDETATNTLLNAQKSARFENQSKSTPKVAKRANVNGNGLHKKARFDPLLEKIDYVDLSERTTDV